MTNIESLRARFEAAGQGHLLREWGALDAGERARLARELDGVDLELVRTFQHLLKEPQAHAAAGSVAPPELFPLARDARLERRAAEARALGDEILRAGKVGFVLVAGGQASRLGYDGPKGAYRIGPVSDRSLFGWHAHRLLAAGARHRVRTPWYVMTSPGNDAATREFFAENEHFGLDPADVFFFSQAMVPALDFDGRILMSSRSSLFLSPNGHGGVLIALQTAGALEDMRRRGVERLSYFQVDNPLVPPADPLFVGLHALEGASMSSKVVAKRDAGEKVGVIGLVDGKTSCIEYSDLPAHSREARDARGELVYRAGNIAVHVLDVAFVDGLTRGELKLPWHVARKSMSVWENGAAAQRQGAKFETFVFDALPLAPRSVTLEVRRDVEFSPVKNASGEDSPATCRADLCRLHASWVRARGWPLPPQGADGVHPVEVDPRVADDRETFLAAPAVAPRKLERGDLYE